MKKWRWHNSLSNNLNVLSYVSIYCWKWGVFMPLCFKTKWSQTKASEKCRKIWIFACKQFRLSNTHPTPTPLSMIHVLSSWWQDDHGLVTMTYKLPLGSDVFALKSAPSHPSVPWPLGPIALLCPQVALAAEAQLAGKGFWHLIHHLWCH